MHRILVALAIATGSAAFPFASSDAHTQGSCVASTLSGDVQGVDGGASCAFLGVPFAAPPVGTLRWRSPQPAAAWAPAVLYATSPPANCPLFTLAGLPGGNEDCLKVNIWTPDPLPAAPAPVIVWFHPGSFAAASANLAAQNGQNLAAQTGAVVIAPNYRLGPFGFLGHRALTAEDPAYASSANYGLLDQRAALAWVRTHIGAFGGDPHNVAIAGQSAGGHSVSLHVVSPGSAGLFDRAIMQGGYASYRWRTLAEAESQGERFAAALGCADDAQVLACLRAKGRDQLLRALPSGMEQFAEGRTQWGPVVDGIEIPDQPRALYEGGAFNRVPVILGGTRDEGWNWVDRSFPAGLNGDQYEGGARNRVRGGRARDPVEVSSGRLPVAQARTCAPGRRRRVRLRGPQARPAHRADAHADVYLFVRLRRGWRRPRPDHSRFRCELRLRQQLRRAFELHAQ